MWNLFGTERRFDAQRIAAFKDTVAVEETREVFAVRLCATADDGSRLPWPGEPSHKAAVVPP
jgi:hypothetical protein